MAERRTIEQVRSELGVQRSLLGDDLAALRAEVRAALPYALGGLAALALATKGSSLSRMLKLLWLLRRFR